MNSGSLNIEGIEDILNSMSSEDMQMLKNAAQDIFSSMNDGAEKKEKKETRTSGGLFDGFSLDIETVGRIMSLMEKLSNRPEDPRCSFLMSLKPMLSKRRQGKVDDAVKMLSLLSLLPIIEELGGK